MPRGAPTAEQPLERILLDAVNRLIPSYDDVRSIVPEEAEGHRLASLAFDGITTGADAGAWPPDLCSALRRASGAQALACGLLDAEVRRVLSGIGEAGIRAVLIKGAAIAHTHYREPHLRPRGDTDLVIRAADRGAIAGVLSALGYRRSGAVDGELVTQQCQWHRRLPAGLTHTLDVHWRLFNPHVFGDVLPAGALLDRAVPIPGLGPYAWSPCAVDALLLACVHRVAHHAGDDDPVWACDIHLLVERLDETAAEEFATRATRAAVSAICADGIRSARARFGTRVPAPIAALIAGAAGRGEQTADFLAPDRRQLDILKSDLKALDSWGSGARLLAQHLFPPAAYIKSKYRFRAPALLPFAYVHRILTGMPRWIRRSRPPTS